MGADLDSSAAPMVLRYGDPKGMVSAGAAFDRRQAHFFGEGIVRGGEGIGLGSRTDLGDELGASMLLVMEVSGAIQASFYK